MRHGQTELNRQQIVQGNKINPPLNEIGIKQIENSTTYFLDNNIHFDLICSSIMTRAIETALIIKTKTSYEKDLYLVSEFVERCYGLAEGMSIFEFRKSKKGELGIETDAELEHRVLRGFNKILELKKECVLIATHSQVLKAFNKFSGNKSFNYYSIIHNGSILELDYNDGKFEFIRLVDLNSSI